MVSEIWGTLPGGILFYLGHKKGYPYLGKCPFRCVWHLGCSRALGGVTATDDSVLAMRMPQMAN